MKLSKKTEYALLSLVHLGRHYPDQKLTINEIAEKNEIPKKYLEQILLQLKQSGYVKSTRGYQGGYSLFKDPKTISLAEIVRLMDGAIAPVLSVSTYFYEETPIENNEKLIDVFKDIRDYASVKLEKTMLSDLL